ATGRTMLEGWGMSETCAIGTKNPVNNPAFSGSIGLPLPGIDIAIKDEAGQSLPLGESGEICIRGPNVTPGYYNQPEENAQAFTADGFLRTGDIGSMDAQGYTRIIDRKKDMILVSGFNV
ncbi:AMP-binding protein, partial [Acidovorax sp. SRB_24]|uniref:AMP-binding protein n=1 Tax=Acidovorax sp. SRB_24 TaxID=1962700 RepID=UPI00145EDEB0